MFTGLLEGEQVRWLKCPTTAEALRRAIEPLAGRCRVAFEVGPQAHWLARLLRPLAVEVQVANAAAIPWLYRSGRKNDRIDARKLARLLKLGELPTVWLPPADVALWRELIQYRRRLVGEQVRIKNRIRALLRSEALRCPYRSCWSRRGRIWLKSLTLQQVRAELLRDLLERLEQTERHLKRLERRLEAIAATRPEVALVRTVPGIGPRTAEALVAFAGDVHRFRRASQFVSYLGLTPREDSSGLRTRRGRISRRGPSVVRWVLAEATHQAIRRDPHIRAYYRRICRGRADRRKKALVATSRKLAVIVHAMLRHRRRYDPTYWTRCGQDRPQQLSTPRRCGHRTGSG